MQYTFNEPDKNSTSGFRTIEIPPERWGWGIVYKDGTELKQFGDDGKFHQVGEINQDEISMAVLYKLDDLGKRIDIPWKDGMRLIHKYRNIVLNYNGPEDQQRKVKIYVFGYKDGDSYSYLFVLPDDRIVFSPTENLNLEEFGI